MAPASDGSRNTAHWEDTVDDVTSIADQAASPQPAPAALVQTNGGPDTIDGGGDREVVRPPSGYLVGQTYSVVRLIGEGGAGTVFEARRQGASESHAVKLFRDSEARASVLREFRLLARLSHPGCVPLHEFGVDAQFGPFLVMELVDGASPGVALEAAAPVTLLNMAANLLETLDYLHAHGVIHGDLKPQNVLCRDGDPLRPVLLDFGLAAHVRDDAVVHGGTINYMAPEVFQCMPRDARSDLYSLGCMLYELACGSPPYEGDLIEVARGHLHGSYVPLVSRQGGHGVGFSRFVDGLLNRRPGDRPASAREALSLLASLCDVTPAKEARQLDPTLLIGAPTLVGRDRVLDAFDGSLTQQSAVIVVHGPAGSGRSRILDELSVRSRLADAVVLRWSGDDPLGSDMGLGAIAAYLRGTREASSAVIDRVSRLRNQILNDTDGWLLGGDYGQSVQRNIERAIDALRGVSREARLVVLVDRYEAADPRLTRLVNGLAAASAGATITLVIATSEGAGSLPAAQGGVTRFDLDLAPLDADDIACWVRTSLGAVDGEETLVRWLEAETSGHAATLDHAIRYLVTASSLVRRNGRWQLANDFEEVELAATGRAEAGSSLAARRLSGLAPDVREFLRAAAVFGVTFDAELLLATPAVSEPEGLWLHALLRRGIIRPDRGGPFPYRFCDRIMRENLAREVPAATRRELHAAFANAITPMIEGRADADPRVAFIAAEHALHIASGRDAARLALRVGEELGSAGLHGKARSLYAAALRRTADDETLRASRSALLVAVGRLEFLAEHCEAAVTAFEEAIALAGGKCAPSVRRALGQALVILGHYDPGVTELQRVVDDASALPDERFAAAYEIGWSRMLQGNWDDALAAATAAATITLPGHERIAGARVAQLRGNILWLAGHWSESLDENRLALSAFAAEGEGEHAHAAQTLMSMGTAHRHLTQYDEANECYREALDVFEKTGLARAIGKAQNNIAIVHFYQGDWRLASEYFEAALEMFERTGERIERIIIQNNLGNLYRERGLLERSEVMLRQARDGAVELGARRHQAMIIGNLAETVGKTGDVVAADQLFDACIELAEELDVSDEVIEAKRRRLEMHALDDPTGVDTQEVERLLEAAVELEQTLEIANLLRLGAAAKRVRGDAAGAKRDLDAALETVAASGAALERVRIERELALVEATLGQRTEAEERLTQLATWCAKVDAAWDAEQTRKALALVSRTDTPAPSEDTSLALVQRLASEIGAEADRRKAIPIALDIMMEITEADRGFIALYDADGLPSSKVVRTPSNARQRPAGREFSTTVARRVLVTGELIHTRSASMDPRFEAAQSVAELGIGAVLALPIKRGADTFGVIYLERDQPGECGLDARIELMQALVSVLSANLARHHEDERELASKRALRSAVGELRLPLDALQSYFELALTDRDELPEQHGVYLEGALEEIQRIGRTVGTVSCLARLDNTKSPRHSFVIISPIEIIETSLRSLTGLLRRKEVDVNVEAPPTTPFVLAARDDFAQVLANIFSWGVDGSPCQSRLTVSVEIVAAAPRRPDDEVGPEAPPSEMLSAVFAHLSRDSMLRVSVQDRGERITDLTQVAGPARSDEGEALPAPLEFGRQVVERYGGQLWTESEARGHGMICRFTMPVMAS